MSLEATVLDFMLNTDTPGITDKANHKMVRLDKNK